MRFPDWFGSVHFLFSSRPRGLRQSRVGKRDRQRDRGAFQKVEGLEPRKMLAFEYVASYVETESPFHQVGDASTPELGISPQQIVLRFTPETQIDPASLTGGISVERSGGANDPFGATGSFQDVTVFPGAIVVDDAPNENQVVVRFVNSLPDDTYQITISGLTTLPDETGAVEQFNGGSSTTVPFRLSLGPNVVSVVPQPLSRPSLAGDPENLTLSQSANEIVVYFDGSEPMEQTSVETLNNYQLIEIDETTAAEQRAAFPTGAIYTAATNSVALQFDPADIADNKTFRLEIGGSGLPVAATAVPEAGLGAGTSFATSQGFGVADALAVLPAEGVLIDGVISTNPTITSTAPVVAGENTELDFPGNPGSILESGHRDIPVNLGGERHGRTLQVNPAVAIPTRFYNFRSDYGTDPQGQTLANQITEVQKQRTREIFEIFSRYLGVQFVESADLATPANDTMTIATGDLRAFDVTIPTTPAGLAGQTSTGNVAIMDSTENWGLSEYGGFWFRTAMQQIGELLGLHHSFDLPSIMGGGLNGEAIFPGDYDLVEARQLFPNAGSDIDLYQFTLSGDGVFHAETIVNRPGDPVTSKLDTVLTLYREDPATNQRAIIARNDDSFGSDSRIELELNKTNSAGADYIYYVAVTAAGNESFNPEIEESGSGGQSEGAYQLRLRHFDKAASSNTVTDASGTPLDGDRDGQAGGVFSFWFQTAEASKTIYVDKIATAAWATVSTEATNTAVIEVDDATGITAGMRVYGSSIPEGVTVVGAPVGNDITISEAIPPTALVAANTSLRFATAEADQDGSLANPFTTVKAAIAEANSFTTDIRTIRIVGNEGNELGGLVQVSAEVEDPYHYYVGKDDQGNILSDGETFIVPAGVTVMIDEGASFRMRRSIVEVGSSSPQAGDSRAGASLQVLGVPNKPVQFSSTDRQFVANTNLAGPALSRSRGHWGGLVFRADSDWQGDVGREVLRPFLNTVNSSIISYGGGQAVVDSQTQAFASIQIEGTRPSLGFNTITTAAGAAIAATPQSFEEGNGRIGVDLRGNQLFGNSVNGVFLLIDTEFGSGTEKLDISARFNDTEVVHVLQENLFIEGGAGGFVRDSNGVESIRPSGRLQIDPGVVVKSYGGRIELERGRSQLIAEGEGYDKVVFTSFGDNRYGAGGTFDSNGNLPDTYAAGDWGGIVGNVGSDISIDNAYLAHAGGLVATEGGFDRFNAIETHQGDLRLANTRIEFNADGNATGTRNARGGNEAGTVFVRGSQPIIVGNDFRNNAGATISINSNALTDEVQGDSGRQTGAIGRFEQYDLNQGPLVRENRISDTVAGDSETGSQFEIVVTYDSDVPSNIVTAVDTAIARWEEIIVGDLSDQVYQGTPVDDLWINVQATLFPLHGPTTIANAGAREPRRSDTDANRYLPMYGEVGFDVAGEFGGGRLNEPLYAFDVAVHEIGHILGFQSETIGDFGYQDQNLDYVFDGNALREYRKVAPGAQVIPMDPNGAHWDLATFGTEVMVPQIGNDRMPISTISVGLLDDLGYDVDYSAADLYTALNGTGLFPPAGASATSAIAGLDIRAEEVTGEKVWDDADIVHVLRDTIEVNNFHTETGLKLLSNSKSSLVVKLDSPDAGLTASGEALDIRDRIGGSVQIVGQPGYPVVLTSLADDTVGASLDINGFPVFDTNADGTATTPSAGDWRSLKFDPLSNDRNVGVFVESERAYTAGLDVNSNTNVAEYVGIIAPNNPETNLVGVPNTFESTQEKNGDDARRLGFEVHGTIAADDPTDVDVYSFYGYGGSEVWFDIDKTTDALDTQLEILDASGNVLARSFDSINDIGVVRANSSADVAENAGGEAIVVGPEQVVTGVVGVADGVAAEVDGAEQTVTGVVGVADGVAAEVNGAEKLVQGVASVTNGVAAVVEGVSADARGVWARATANVAGSLTVSIDTNAFDNRLAGAAVFHGGGPEPLGVQVVEIANSVVTLTGLVTIAGNQIVYFQFADPDEVITHDNIWLKDPAGQAGTQITGDVPDDIRALAVSAGTVAQQNRVTLSEAIPVKLDNEFIFGFNGFTVDLDTNDLDGAVAGAAITINGNETTSIVDSITDDILTLDETANTLDVVHGDVLGFTFAGAPVTTDHIRVDDADLATVGAAVTVNGVAAGTVAADGIDLVANTVRLSAPTEFEAGDFVEFTFADTKTTTRVTVGDATGIEEGVLVNGAAGIPAGTRVAAGGLTLIDALDPTAGAVIELDAPVDILNTDTIGFGFESDTIPLDTTSLNGEVVGAAITLNDEVVDGVTVTGIAAGVLTASGVIENVSDGDVLSFEFAGAPVTTDHIRVDDADLATVGAAVTVNGVAAGTVAADGIDLVANTVRLSAPTEFEAGAFVEFTFADTKTTTRVTVGDATGIEEGVLVNGAAGIPAGTRVAAGGLTLFDALDPTAGAVIELDAPVDILNTDTIGFGFESDTIPLDTTSLNGEVVGAAITLNDEVVDGVTVTGIAAGVLTASGVIENVSDGDVLSFEFAGAPVTTDHIRVDDADLATVGAAVTVNGVAAGTVAADGIDLVANTVRLSAPTEFEAGDFVEFTFADTKTTTRVTVGDATGIEEGVLVNGAAGIPDGTRVAVGGISLFDPIDPTAGAVIELDAPLAAPIDILNTDTIGFGFIADTITIDDITDISIGSPVGGDGIDPDTTVLATDGANISISFGDTADPVAARTVNVADGTLLAFARRGFNLNHANILPGTLAGVIYQGNTATQEFSVARDGTFTFTAIGDPVSEATSESSVDLTTGVVTLEFDVPPTASLELRDLSYEWARVPLGADGLAFLANGELGGYSLNKDAHRGADSYSANPRDAGLRMTLPGVAGRQSQYFVRVRSQVETLFLPTVGDANDTDTITFTDVTGIVAGMRVMGNNMPAGAVVASVDTDMNTVTIDPSIPLADTVSDGTELAFLDVNDTDAGKTSGRYQLRMRLRQQDEKPGSVVTFADVRYATTGIDVTGLPNNSPLTGTAGEDKLGNESSLAAQQLGNLLAIDRNTISVAGDMSGATDVDWYEFEVDYEQIEVLEGINDQTKTWATTFDVDFGAGVRGDYTLSVFDANTNRLVYVGRDSNIADDLADPSQGDTDADDLTRGSAGVNDPFIGTVQLPEGRYYVAVSTNAQLPEQLDQNFFTTATNPDVRLEPLSSLNRIVDDKIGSAGYLTEAGFFGPAQNQGRNVINVDDGFALQANVQPFTLADMTVFITEGNRLRTINPFTGVADPQPGTSYNYAPTQTAGDLDMLTDGRLVVYIEENSGANVGTVYVIDPATGNLTTLWGDSIADRPNQPQATDYWKTNSNSPDALAIGYSNVATYAAGSNAAGSLASATYYAIEVGGVSRLYGANTNGNASSDTGAPPGHRFGYMGDIDPDRITSKTVGLQFRNESKGSDLFGVSEDGQFFRIVKKNHGGATGPSDVQVDDVVDFGTILDGRQLGGLATGPVNLEGGRFAGTFFAVTTRGELFCIDPTGGAGGEAVIVDNVFDSDGDGIADSWISNPTGNNVRGVAFSPLDVNLWHTTRDKSDNITSSLTHDLTRTGLVVGGQSMHFGLEEWVGSNTPYVEYVDVDGGGAGQFGVRSSGVWQRHLSQGLGISESTYDLPGGAHGRMQTDAFSLAGYSSSDKPTLYFSYWLETQDADAAQVSGRSSAMRDSARVLGSADGGQTWTLLATNNTQKSGIDGSSPQAELPPRLTPSANAANAGSDASERQQVQELFDTAEWRQARVDLAQFAGESSVLLRFDFSTGGDLDRGGEINNAKIVADATREAVSVTPIPGSPTNDVTVFLDSVQGLSDGVGNIAVPNAEIVFNAGETSTGVATVVSIDTAAESVVLRPVDVIVELEDVYDGGPGPFLIDFYSAGANRDNILGLGGTLGDFGNPTARSEDNNYRGFNIDAIMVGFAERGEAVVNASSEPNAQFFGFNQDRTGSDYPEQVLEGEYQLEIRRGSEFGSQPGEGLPGLPDDDVRIDRTFDTNDRMVRETAVTSLELAQNDLTTVTGEVSQAGELSGIPLVLRDINGAPVGRLLQGTGGFNSETEHSVLKWSVDLANQPAAFLSVDYSVSSQEVLSPLPETFTITDENDLPSGDGLAISVDDGTTWFRVTDFAATTARVTQYTSSLEVNLAKPVVALSDETVIGFFRSGANAGGIEVGNAVIRTAPLVITSGLVGDKNNEFENQQGQFIVQNTIVTDASTYGIRIDAGRVGDGSQSPDLGVAQNRAVLNNAGLVPGAVVTNTVVANAGVAGIYFGGTADTANDTNSVRPYGRLLNNTIYGGGSGIGIDVANNAAPTIMNNVFSELDTGVKVDSSSRLDGAGAESTVIGTSAFYLVGTEVDGANQSRGVTLTEDPFVDKARNNFYPAPNSRIIDSSMNSLEDRTGFTVVRDAINIPDSPILAPQKDLYGLTRDDDPDVASIPGLGLNAFKDRGAIERLDINKPSAALAMPLDQSQVAPIDLNNSLHAVELEGAAARQQEKFVLQLSDVGTGIDQVSVTENENMSVTVTGVYARVLGDFVNLDTLDLDTSDFNGLLVDASVSINNVDAGVTVTSIVGNTLTLSGPVTAVDNSVVSFGLGDTTSVSTKYVVVSNAASVNAGILINGISGVATANAIVAVDAGMNMIELDEAATVASDAEITLTAFLLQRDGQVLAAGNDYFFQYNTNTNQVVFAAASTFTLGDYELRVAPTVQDLAGNSLLVNDAVNGTTEFSIILLDVPSQPSAPLGVSGDRQVTLSWGAPSTSVSAPITDYIIETSNDDGVTWEVFDDGESTLTTATVTTHGVDGGGVGVPLENGTSYRFRVRGVSRVGEGENSPPSAAITPLRLPSAPLNLAVATANKSLNFEWDAPTDDGEDLLTNSIIDYVVEYSADDGVTWEVFDDGQSTLTTATVTGLTGGVEYKLRVAARNARGLGPYATVSSPTTPQSEPGLVQNLSLVAGVGEVTLDWDPGANGGLAIEEYVVKFSINSGPFDDANWDSTAPGPVTKGGLSTGDQVVAEVFATNSIGEGPVATSNTAIVGGIPGVVTGLTFTEEDGAVALSWTAPADTGGHPVIDYIIESSADGGATWEVFDDGESNLTTATVIAHGVDGNGDGVPLVNGDEYSFRVYTETSVARSATATEITGGPAVPHTLPSAPVLNTPTFGEGSIDITWSAPDDGGKPISDYVVQYIPASQIEEGMTASEIDELNWNDFSDGTSTLTSATITGVTNGVSYVVRVAAVNQKGQGPWSDVSASVVPGAVPDEIADLNASAQDGAVGLTWTVPASTLTVTSHQVRYKKQSDLDWTPALGDIAENGSAATTTITGLTNGVDYVFEVVAVNAVGSSPAASASATPFALPGAVTNFVAENAGNNVSKSWSAPASNGGGTITDYVVQYRLASSSTWITFADGVSPSLSARTTGLSVGQTYVFRVAAQTQFGTGAFTQSGEVTVGSTPAAPARVTAWKEGNNIQVLWDRVTMPAGVTFQYYQIQYREVGDGVWSDIAQDSFNSELLSGSNFTRGKTYQFRVAAVANTGAGTYKVSNNVAF